MAMHRALNLPELLSNVFAFLDYQSGARTARVCKTWSEHALNEPWKNVDIMVFRSLAPLNSTVLEEESMLVSVFFKNYNPSR